MTLGQRVSDGEEIGILKDWFGDEIERIKAARDAWIIAIVTTPAAVKNAIIYQVAYEQEGTSKNQHFDTNNRM